MIHQRIEAETRAKRVRHREKVNADFRARHPDRAREERGFRKNQATLAERYDHRRAATNETLDKVSHVQQGAMARLFANGHLSIDQLAWAQEIQSIAASIQREVGLATVSVETRVDNGALLFRREWETLGRVRAEMAYTAWRAGLEKAGPVLAMVVEDRMCRPVAKAFRMRDEALRKMVIDALEAWPDYCHDARDRVSEDDLIEAHARLV